MSLTTLKNLSKNIRINFALINFILQFRLTKEINRMLFKQLPLSLQILVIIICIKGAILQTNEFFGNYKILVLKNPSELEEGKCFYLF